MLINKKIRSALLAAVCGACLAHAPSAALAQKAVPAADAQSRKIVAAADAFLATLSPDQKTAALFAWESDQRAKWSNFPSDFYKRSGVRWGELNEPQRAALMDLLGAVLSPRGVTMIKQQMAADDIVRDTSPTAAGGRGLPGQGGPGGPGGQGGPAGPGGPGAPGAQAMPAIHFGSDYFFLAFVGAPSTTKPWMLQFSAHHLALNATVVGPHVTLSPTLNGGEPLHYTGKDGKPVYIVEEEATAASALLNSLTAEQRSKAVMGPKLIQLVLGPGHDGQTLQPEGLPGSAMTVAQKALFVRVIEGRLGILNADDLPETLAPVRQNLNATYFAWYGPTDVVGGAYFRVTGPTVLIEFSPQAGDGRFPATTEHDHNMYRDPTNEYGAAWTPLK